MVEVRYKARLGNNLFQYCLGRIIAEELGHSLSAPPIPGFPSTNQLVTGDCASEPIQTVVGHRISLQGILSDRTPRKIILDGWFQRAEYYRPYRDRIRDWLAFDPAVCVPKLENDVVVHVRRTDYITVGWALPYSFYSEAIQRILPDGGRVWIVTDDPSDPFFRHFRSFRPRFYTGTALQQMALMTQSPRLVISQSTFSWWPAFLGNHDSVVCPNPSFGCWSGKGESAEIDLIEGNGFQVISCPRKYEATSSEERHQRLRKSKRNWVLRLNRWLRVNLPIPPP